MNRHRLERSVCVWSILIKWAMILVACSTRILATNCCHPNLLLLQPKNSEKGAGTPDGIRTRDLRRERAMS